MTKRFTLFTIPLIAGIVLLQSSGNMVHSNAAGAPAGNTGSPADNFTCARSGCHSGTASVSGTQLISSNIPASGYVPGTRYTITASITGSNKFGFQISPQSASGALQGTLLITNTSATKIVSSKYVTHTSGGNSGTGGMRSWSFDWVAPAAGTGSVTFYGAFNIANGNNASSGDQILTNTMTVNENVTIGISEIGTQVAATVYPNPVTNRANFEFELVNPAEGSIQIMDAAGRIISHQEMEMHAGKQTVGLDVSPEWPSGLYKIVLSAGDQHAVRNFIKQ